MSDLLPQLIVLALGGAIAPSLLLLTSLFWGSQRPLPNTTALGLGYFPICTTMGVAGLTLFRRGGRSEGTGGREEVTQEREK
jgi:hypothetical protein